MDVARDQNAMALMSFHCIGILYGQHLVGVVNDNHGQATLVEALPHCVCVTRGCGLGYRGTTDVSRHGYGASHARRNQATQESASKRAATENSTFFTGTSA